MLRIEWSVSYTSRSLNEQHFMSRRKLFPSWKHTWRMLTVQTLPRYDMWFFNSYHLVSHELSVRGHIWTVSCCAQVTGVLCHATVKVQDDAYVSRLISFDMFSQCKLNTMDWTIASPTLIPRMYCETSFARLLIVTTFWMRTTFIFEMA